jgi:hypothetical protein
VLGEDSAPLSSASASCVTSVVIACSCAIRIWPRRAPTRPADRARAAPRQGDLANASGSPRSARSGPPAPTDQAARSPGSPIPRTAHRHLRRHEPKPADPREPLAVRFALLAALRPRATRTPTSLPTFPHPSLRLPPSPAPQQPPHQDQAAAQPVAPTWAPTVADHPHSPHRTMFLVGAGGQERLGAQTPHAHGLSGSPIRTTAHRLEPGPETEPKRSPNGGCLRRRVLTRPPRARVPARSRRPRQPGRRHRGAGGSAGSGGWSGCLRDPSTPGRGRCRPSRSSRSRRCAAGRGSGGVADPPALAPCRTAG